MTAKLRDFGADRLLRNHEVGLWRTLGYQLLDWDRGSARISWKATEEYGFSTDGGYVIQGGLITALLDAAMGSACWTVLDYKHVFLTADLRVEFLRSTRPGLVTAKGTVVRSSRRVVFCAGELFDTEGQLLASSRCTQIVLPIDHRAGRGTEAEVAVD